MNRIVIAFVLALAACGNGTGDYNPGFGPPNSPDRTAAQDEALRALLMDVATARACEALQGQYLPLPEDRPEGLVHGEQPIIEGRLAANECSVERSDDHLALSLRGRGWQWVDRSASGPLGSAFRVRGHIRFAANVALQTDVDFRYDQENHRAIVSLTPRQAAQVNLRPTGSVPVTAQGGWSDLIGGLGSMMGSSVDGQARSMIQSQGAAMVRGYLREGATFALNLCTGQLDGALGALEDGEGPPPRPYDDDEEGLWLDNARVRLRPGGLDLTGPWETRGARIVVNVDVEEGGSVDVTAVCDEEAAAVASRFLASDNASVESPLAHGAASYGEPLVLTIESAECARPVIFVTTTHNETSLYRYRVRREGDRPESWARCGE